MRIKQLVSLVAASACAACVWAGCASTQNTADADGATTPQDKAHQQQLADLSQEDSDTADTPTRSKHQRPSDRATQGRRTGQGVIDQPTGR